MNRIIKYEIQRLLLNRYYFGLLVINILFAAFILSTETILGAGYTAPFSGWSLGSYWAMVLPVTMVIVLHMLISYFSPQVKRVEILTSATAVDPTHYAIARLWVVSLGFGIIIIMLFLLGVIFTTAVFGEWPWFELAVTMMFTAIPCFLFTLGFGYALGHIHWRLIYALMAIVLLAGFFPMNNILDFFGSGYFANKPLTLPAGLDGEPPFTYALGFLAMRCLYFLTGAVILAASFLTELPRLKHGPPILPLYQ